MAKARIAVIGAGLMGHGIAQVFALAGHEVTIYDLRSRIVYSTDNEDIGEIKEHNAGFTAARVGRVASATVRIGFVYEGSPIIAGAGTELPPVDFKAVGNELQKTLGRQANMQEVLSYLLYPKVFNEFMAHHQMYSDVSILPTNVFFYGQEPGQEVAVEIERGKTLIVKFLTVGDPHPDGRRTVFFELNGQPRSINVRDLSLEPEEKQRTKADRSDPKQVGAPMPGLVVTVSVKLGDAVPAGHKLLSLEAIKMETTLYAERAGKVAELLVKPGTQVDANDLLLRFE